MKKLAILICLFLLLLPMVLPASAKETAKVEDSVTIPEEVLSCLNTENIDTIFCVYLFESQFSQCRYDGFARYGNIDGILANMTEAEMRRYYFVKDKAGETAIYTYDGVGLTKGYIGKGSWFDRHGEEASSIIQNIDPNIVVENIYYLWYYNWAAIYYKTNMGDYAYVTGGYLMAREPFLELQEELYEMSVRYRYWRSMDSEPYHVKLNNIKADFSPYDMDAPDFNPYAKLKVHYNYKPGRLIAIGSFVLLIALIVGRIVIRNRRKTRKTGDITVNRI